MSNTTFDRPDLSAFTRLYDLGLEVTGQCIEADHAVLACRITGADRWCRRCGCQGICRDTVVRRLAHEPYGWRPTILHVSVRRYRCPECAHVWRQDMSQAAEPGTSSPTSTTPTPPMALPKRSTAASNTYAAPPSDSETSPTTSPEHSLKQEDSDPNYTLNYEEPHMAQTHKREVGLTITLPLRCFKIARLTSHDS